MQNIVELQPPKNCEYFLGLRNSFNSNILKSFTVDGQNFLLQRKKSLRKDFLFNLAEYTKFLSKPVYFICPNFLLKKIEQNDVNEINNEFKIIRINCAKIDDWIILDVAKKLDSIIISNDNYKDYKSIFSNDILDRVINFFSYFLEGKFILTIPFIEFLKQDYIQQTD